MKYISTKEIRYGLDTHGRQVMYCGQFGVIVSPWGPSIIQHYNVSVLEPVI